MVSGSPKIIIQICVAPSVPQKVYYYGIGPLKDNPLRPHQVSISEAEGRPTRLIFGNQPEIVAFQDPFVAFWAWYDLVSKALAPDRQAFAFQVTLQVSLKPPRRPYSTLLSSTRQVSPTTSSSFSRPSYLKMGARDDF